MGARRLLLFGGIALVAAGMLFGDIFAVFVLHQNGGQTRQALLAAARAVAAQDPFAVNIAFSRLGNLLGDCGTKGDAHLHIIYAGYLSLFLALMPPYLSLSATRKKL